MLQSHPAKLRLLLRPRGSALLCTHEGTNRNETKPLDPKRRARTAVLFLHLGEPRCSKDAHGFLHEQAAEFYQKVPFCVSKAGVDIWMKAGGRHYLDQLFYKAEISRLPHVSTIHDAQRQSLKNAMDTLTPEFAPFECYFGYRFGYERSIETAIDDVQSDAPEHVVVVPQYSHYWCFQSQTCLKELSRLLTSKSVPTAADPNARQLIRKDAFQVSPPITWSVIDRWPSHPALAEAWAQAINKELLFFPSDARNKVGIVFCAPYKRFYDRTMYEQQVYSSCIRISDALRNRFPWRFGWFSSWDQNKYRGRQKLLSSMRFLVRQNHKNIIVVPLTQTTSCLDTQVILPSLLSESNLQMVGASLVRTARPLNEHSVYATGLAELVKNHLLDGARSTAQFSLKCPNCFSSSCHKTKQMFTNSTSSSIQLD